MSEKLGKVGDVVKLNMDTNFAFKEFIRSEGGSFGEGYPLDFSKDYEFESHWVNATREGLEYVLRNVVNSVLGREHTKDDLKDFLLVHINGTHEGIEVKYKDRSLGVITHKAKERTYTVEFTPIVKELVDFGSNK